ncbi:hypothetical protein AYI68_g6835 [Smittium mucronatum]|uniref:Peptidase S1 domain-containing protein n=1 Tax=Smittium mucronatum TaxID=133383 RepID=A0A1R0GQD1_9FUNG|nr:hypothetical protein AYI68_g6835 [Smittium mucronatum]
MFKLNLLYTLFLVCFIHKCLAEDELAVQELDENRDEKALAGSKESNVWDIADGLVVKILQKVDGKEKLLCLGYLYSKDYVIVLASCVKDAEDGEIQIGSYYELFEDRTDAVVIRSFNKSNTDSAHYGENDIALLKLNSEIEEREKCNIFDEDLSELIEYELGAIRMEEGYYQKLDITALDRYEMIGVMCSDCIGYETSSKNAKYILKGMPIFAKVGEKLYLLGLSHEYNESIYGTGNKLKRAGIMTSIKDHQEWIEAAILYGGSKSDQSLDKVLAVEKNKEASDKYTIETLRKKDEELIEIGWYPKPNSNNFIENDSESDEDLENDEENSEYIENYDEFMFWNMAGNMVVKILQKVDDKEKFLCLGAIYSNQYAIVLASCVKGVKDGELQIGSYYDYTEDQIDSDIIESYDKSDNDDDLQIDSDYENDMRRIGAIVIRSFNKSNNDGSHYGENDIALLKLNSEIEEREKCNIFDEDLSELIEYELGAIRMEEGYYQKLDITALDTNEIIDVACIDCIGYETCPQDEKYIIKGMPIFAKNGENLYLLGLSHEYNESIYGTGDKLKRAGIMTSIKDHQEWIEAAILYGGSKSDQSLDKVLAVEKNKEASDKYKIENLRIDDEKLIENGQEPKQNSNNFDENDENMKKDVGNVERMGNVENFGDDVKKKLEEIVEIGKTSNTDFDKNGENMINGDEKPTEKIESKKQETKNLDENDGRMQKEKEKEKPEEKDEKPKSNNSNLYENDEMMINGGETPAEKIENPKQETKNLDVNDYGSDEKMKKEDGEKKLEEIDEIAKANSINFDEKMINGDEEPTEKIENKNQETKNLDENDGGMKMEMEKEKLEEKDEKPKSNNNNLDENENDKGVIGNGNEEYQPDSEGLKIIYQSKSQKITLIMGNLFYSLFVTLFFNFLN